MSIELIGLGKVKQKFENIVKNLKDSTPVMKEIALKGYKQVIENFDNEKDDKGKSWQKWLKNGKRVSHRPTKRGGTKLLQDSGRLRNATTFLGTKRQAIIKNSVGYAGVHNRGAPSKNIVQRKFLWISKQNISLFGKIFLKYMVR